MQKTISLSRYEREGEREGNEEGDEEDVGEEGKIKRVLIFATNTLMKAFEESDGKASVDGTFFMTPKLGKQTFVLSIKVGGLWIPVAYGLLPDKKETSYLAFHFMLKRKLQNNNIKINLVSMMMDYEINVQQAAVGIAHIPKEDIEAAVEVL